MEPTNVKFVKFIFFRYDHWPFEQLWLAVNVAKNEILRHQNCIERPNNSFRNILSLSITRSFAPLAVYLAVKVQWMTKILFCLFWMINVFWNLERSSINLVDSFWTFLTPNLSLWNKICFLVKPRPFTLPSPHGLWMAPDEIYI